MIKAVVVGKGADFSNYPDDEDDGQPVMPQVSAQHAHPRPHPHSTHSCSTTQHTVQPLRPHLVSTVLQLLRGRAHVGSCWRGRVLLAVASSVRPLAGSRPLGGCYSTVCCSTQPACQQQGRALILMCWCALLPCVVLFAAWYRPEADRRWTWYAQQPRRRGLLGKKGWKPGGRAAVDAPNSDMHACRLSAAVCCVLVPVTGLTCLKPSARSSSRHTVLPLRHAQCFPCDMHTCTRLILCLHVLMQPTC